MEGPALGVNSIRNEQLGFWISGNGYGMKMLYEGPIAPQV